MGFEIGFRSKETARDVDEDRLQRALLDATPERGWVLVTRPAVASVREVLPEEYDDDDDCLERRVLWVHAQFDYVAEGALAELVRTELGLDPADHAVMERRCATELAQLLEGMRTAARLTSTHWRMNYCGMWAGFVRPSGIDASAAAWLATWRAGGAADAPAGWSETDDDGDYRDPWPERDIYPAVLKAEKTPAKRWRIELVEVGPRRDRVIARLRDAGHTPQAALAIVKSLPAVIFRAETTRRLVEPEVERWKGTGALVRLVADD